MEHGTSLKSRTPAALVEYLMSVFDKSRVNGWQKVTPRKKVVEEKSVNPAPTEINLPARTLRAVHRYRVGKVERVEENLQLLMKLEAEMVNGEVQIIKVLIDTGAQANLIRKGLVDDHLMYAARKPLTLATANGQRLEGGARITRLGLKFRQVEDGYTLPGSLAFNADFYEADG